MNPIKLVTIRLFSALAMILASAIVTNNFTSEKSSYYFLFLSSYNLLLLIILWGGDLSIAKKISKYKSNEKIFDLFSESLIVSVFLALFLFFPLVLYGNNAYLSGLIVATISTPIIIVSFIQRGLKRFVEFQFYRNGVFSISLIISSSACVFFFDINMVPLIIFIFILISTCFVLKKNKESYTLITKQKIFSCLKYNLFNIPRLLKKRFSFFLIGFCNTSIFWLDTIITSSMIDNSLVSIVGIIGRLSAAINMIYLLVFNYYSPHISEICANSNNREILRLVGRMQLKLISVWCVGCILYYFIGGYVFSIFGQEYTAYKDSFWIILLAHLFLFSFGLFRSVLYFSGKQNFVALTSVISLAIYIFSAIIGGGIYGLFGILFAFLLANIFSTIPSVIYLYKYKVH